uniref:autotransporter domain-containing protein n=1 Tax=Klebsiella michiganensis TaxID=1134687 RepID=UPI0013D292EA
PYAALQATALFMPAYRETATSGTGALALSYASRSFTATRSELGVRVDTSVTLDGLVLTLKAKAAWAHD